MAGDAGLVSSIVDRLATRLPHRTGANAPTLAQDEILRATRATIVQLGITSIDLVLESLITVLEALSYPYGDVTTHPPHVLLSELYVLALAADCCSASRNANQVGERALLTFDAKTVGRTLDVLRALIDPVPDSFHIPSHTLLDEDFERHPSKSVDNLQSQVTIGASGPEASGNSQDLQISGYIKQVVEFVTLSSWSASFDYLRSILHNVRTNTVPNNGSEASRTAQEVERAALATLRLLGSFWVDGNKLSLVLQELASSYLHFRRSYQNVISAVMPLLVTRWIDRYPDEFVQLHQFQRRMDGGADTLFDMTSTATDNARRKSLLFPMQSSLILLLPDVFEVASNLKEAKSGSMLKKVAFLDTLRKALRNGNEQAAWCLVSLLRAARHFNIESDSALVSYAMDVQDEVRDAVFRRTGSELEGIYFDCDLMTAAFVSLAHLQLDATVSTLVGVCISPTSPTSFKIAAINGCAYFARQSYAWKCKELFEITLPFMRKQLNSACAESSDIPDKFDEETENLLCSILHFLEASPDKLHGSSKEDSLMEPFLLCVLSPSTSIRQLAMRVAIHVFEDPTTRGTSSREPLVADLPALRRRIWTQSSRVLLGFCERVAVQRQEAILDDLHQYLKARLLLLKHVGELSDVPADVAEVVTASSRLETTLLFSLCSADVETCRIVTSCIGMFLQECAIINKHVESAKATASVLRNSDIFREIASPDFRFTGLVAFQKRIRTLLRRMQFPTTAILNTWEAGFERWLHLSKDVSAVSADPVDDKILAEWRNYSGFLASLGGICVADQAIILEEPALGGLRWIDRLPSDHYEEPPLTRFLRLSIQLLGCANVRVREAMRDVLSGDVASTLYQPLFRALETALEVLFTGALAPSEAGQNGEIIFADQSASLLRSLVDKLQTPAELGAASSVHLGAVTLNFAKFLDGINDTTDALRVKIRVCQLCEVVTRRKEHLNLRDDVHIRNQLLEYIFGWITRPKSPYPDHTVSARDDLGRYRKDLDRACLKALAEVTFRLPLQPLESQTDAGMSEMKSQMFHTYFNRFLSLLNHETVEHPRSEGSHAMSAREEAIPNSELAITILSNLLSANIDVGLKHSLNIGYHDNVAIRTAFVKVLYNILVQGTEFSNLTDSAVSEKYEELLDLLTKDLSLSAAMAAICPSNEVEELTVCLLTIFEQRGLTFELLDMLIKQEINHTDNEAEILRRTCVATKMLSVYAKWKGSLYLKGTLQKVLERLMLTSQDLDLELDPTKVSSAEELQKNALQLRIVAKVFIDDICESSSNIPPAFRRICNIISEAVQPRFPDAKYTAVGAFVFLRFFCPAIVAPEVEGLVASTPSKEMRRGLLLIAKVIQNLANNVLFGAKEPYMFPLNNFLTQNIYRVTTFLREICVPPPQLEARPGPDIFDFGSCVALHRFLYDHWDHVRQTLVSRERRDVVRSPIELARGRSPTLEPLRNLIANLGPPPLAVSWNRPQISANSPPLYARFQNFMLTNAFRSSETVLTSRAVYDGGESKDGYSIICIILRHVESEGIDYETLLFCYLKIASRLWQKPFGLFIDATCYNGRNEPQDELFKMLELLAPAELARNLSRIYIYNMDNAFKRCFRRLLRICARSDDGVFHPNNVDYHLIGSLQELQIHFHLSQLHLPKETISVVTDTRYVFQPITRLSKSKGKIEVVIKIGGQFVQVTTTKKQEVYAGFRLNTTVNDIFRLSDIDEAATSIQTEDDSAFGLRADSGKMIMYFTSSKKNDILQSIRGAKAKYGKDSRSQKPLERLIRPQDVPGTLLNLALTNLSSADHGLRLSSYNLLGALCKAFKFEAAATMACTKDVFVPPDAARFVVGISRELARTEPQLTADFLTEFFVGWESFPDENKAMSLAYMAPWLPGLRTHVLASDSDGDKARERVAALFRKLIDLAIIGHGLNYNLEQVVWPVLGQDEVLLEIFIDELVKTALEYGAQDRAIEQISSVMVGIGTITLRGKVLSRLRKALNRSSLRATKSLPDNAVWAEICVLLQFCLVLSFNNGVQAQMFVPEVFHIVTMLASTGNHATRQTVHRLLVNTVHAMSTTFTLDEVRGNKVRAILEVLGEPRGDHAVASVGYPRDGASVSTAQDAGPQLAAIESLAATLFEVCIYAAPSADMANAWRSRWMSLVASTAFQNNPAIQPRAFTVMGYLAREEVDDDLLYQVLVALRNSVSHFNEDANTEMLLAIITSLSKMMAKLPSASRYGLQLFWLAISLVRLVPAGLFNCTVQFLNAVMVNIGTVGEVKGDKMVPLLLQGRAPLEEAALQLDGFYGIHFKEETFHYAVCACLVRGLTDTLTRSTTLGVLSSFLDMTVGAPEQQPLDSAARLSASPYLTLIRARAVRSEEQKDVAWLTDDVVEGVDRDMDDGDGEGWEGLRDEDLLLISAIELVDFQYLEDSVQAQTLRWLNKLAEARPNVIIDLSTGLRPIITEILLHGQSAAVLEASHVLLSTLNLHERLIDTTASSDVTEALDEMGFEGLWRSCSVQSMEDVQQECFELTEKLIELIII